MDGRVKPLAVLVLAAAPAAGQTDWRLELLAGSAYSFPHTFSVHQAGFPDLQANGHFSTRPFRDAPYLAGRAARWSGNRGWELQVIHHKVILNDPVFPVERLEISHGYSLGTLQRAGRWRAWEWRLGAGLVLAHPESTIRRRTVVTGYDLTGPCGLAGGGRRWRIGPHWTLSAEGQLSLARARVRVADGSADVPNLAVHGLVGLGAVF